VVFHLCPQKNITVSQAQLHVKQMVYERIELLRLKRLDALRAKLSEAAIVVLQRWEFSLRHSCHSRLSRLSTHVISRYGSILDNYLDKLLGTASFIATGTGGAMWVPRMPLMSGRRKVTLTSAPPPCW